MIVLHLCAHSQRMDDYRYVFFEYIIYLYHIMLDTFKVEKGSFCHCQQWHDK